MPKLNGLGMNYYHESMGDIARSNSQIEADLDKIQTLTNKIKIYHNPLVANDSVAVNICERAKSRGMYVVWTENNDNTVLTEITWASTYTPAVVADALVAHNARADEFLVGNELSIHNDNSDYFNDTGLPAITKTLASACAANFTRTKGLQEGWWKASAWDNAESGGLKIYFTLYENQNSFQTIITDILNKNNIGTPIIGEFSTQSTMNSVAGTDENKWANMIANKCEILRVSGIEESYVFTFRDSGDENNGRGYGMLANGDDDNYHIAWQSLSGGRRRFYEFPNKFL